MTYELAKQLKDAGFTLSKKRILLGLNQKAYKKSNSDILSADFEYIPTLSELIEACRDRDGIVLWRFNGKWKAGQGEKWSGHQIYGDIDLIQTGSTQKKQSHYYG